MESPTTNQSPAPTRKTSSGVLVLAYLIGSCFGLGLIGAIGATGAPGIVVGLLGALGCGALFKKARVASVLGIIGCLLMALIGVGSIQSNKAKETKALADKEVMRAAQAAADAKHAELAAKLNALPSGAKPEEVLPICADAAEVGIPADHTERCGTVFFAQGQALLGKDREAGVKFLGLATRTQSSKQGEATTLLAKLEAETVRSEGAALLKAAQAKVTAGDLAGARADAVSVQERAAKALASRPADKALGDMVKAAEAQVLRIDQEQEKQAKAKRRATYIKESCAQLSRTFGPSSKLSDIQKDELWKSYEGKEFAWDLEVVEVSEAMLGGYTVQFKCGRNSPSLIQDIQMNYPKKAKSLVMQLQKGDVYEVEGRLKTTSTLLGLTADPI